MTMYHFVTVPFFVTLDRFVTYFFVMYRCVAYHYGTHRCVTYHFVMYRYVMYWVTENGRRGAGGSRRESEGKGDQKPDMERDEDQ
jgi:hypothetical protein